MVLPIGPVLVGSDTPPWLPALPEFQVRRNLFAAGPISPIVDQLDAANRQIGPSTPDPQKLSGACPPSSDPNLASPVGELCRFPL